MILHLLLNDFYRKFFYEYFLQHLYSYAYDDKMDIALYNFLILYTVYLNLKKSPIHLYYLKKGGRVSAFAAAAGTVLKIKPVLSFTNEGKLTVVEKCKGMKKAFSWTLEKMKRFPPVEEGRMIWIVHTDAEEEANELAAMVEEKWGYRPDVTIMGPVIGSHVGPGSVSMIWKTKEERQD